MAMPVNSIYTAVHGSSSLEQSVSTVGFGVPGFTGGLGSMAGTCSKCVSLHGLSEVSGSTGGLGFFAGACLTRTVGGDRGVVTLGLVVSLSDPEQLEFPLGAPTFAIGFSATILKGGSLISISWSLVDDFVQQVPIYNLCVCEVLSVARHS